MIRENEYFPSKSWCGPDASLHDGLFWVYLSVAMTVITSQIAFWATAMTTHIASITQLLRPQIRDAHDRWSHAKTP